jgi:hypothetical protein
VLAVLASTVLREWTAGAGMLLIASAPKLCSLVTVAVYARINVGLYIATD